MNKRTTNSLAIEDFQKDNNIAFGILYKNILATLGNLFSKTKETWKMQKMFFRMR